MFTDNARYVNSDTSGQAAAAQNDVKTSTLSILYKGFTI